MYSWKVTATLGRLSTRKRACGSSYLDGEVATPFGYVLAWSDDGTSSLRFMWGGREYSKVIKRPFTRRGLATVAARFAREIATQEDSHA